MFKSLGTIVTKQTNRGVDMEHAIGTLIKTETIHGLFHGLVTDWHYCGREGYISVQVTWNDCDKTEETFCDDGEVYATDEYFFYHKGRWWEIHHNFHKFMAKLEVL